MCLLIVNPEGKSIPYEYLQNAERANRDGAGLAYIKDNRVVIEKAYNMTAREIYDKLAKIDGPSLVHFRLSTINGVSDALSHPFPIGDEWIFAHNGILPISSMGGSGKVLDILPHESDTTAYARHFLSPEFDFSDKLMLQAIGKHIGSYNKMGFLHQSGAWGIANEESGHWKEKIWFSNYGYQSYTPVTTYYPSRDYSKSSYWDRWDNKRDVRTVEPIAEWPQEDDWQNEGGPVHDTDERCAYCWTNFDNLSFKAKIVHDSQGNPVCAACEEFIM